MLLLGIEGKNNADAVLPAMPHGSGPLPVSMSGSCPVSSQRGHSHTLECTCKVLIGAPEMTKKRTGFPAGELPLKKKWSMI